MFLTAAAPASHPFWDKAGVVPSTTSADGDCLLHSLAATVQPTVTGWKAAPQVVTDLRGGAALLMRQHAGVLAPLNLYHKGEDYEKYCSAYGDSPAGVLPSAYWSDDCSVLALAEHLQIAIVKIEPCSDGSLLFSLFHHLQRREGVEEAEVLALLKTEKCVCVYFNGSNHYTRCVPPAQDHPTPAWPPPASPVWPMMGLGEDEYMWTPELPGFLIGRTTFYRSISRPGEKLGGGDACMWLDEDMQWQYGVLLGILRQQTLQCLMQMFTTEGDDMRMGLFTLVDTDEVSCTANSWCGALYRCAGGQLVAHPGPRVMRTFLLAKLAEQLWELAQELWTGGGRLAQQHSMPLEHVGLIYSKPSRAEGKRCDLCGDTVRWRCTLRYPSTTKEGVLHILHWCEACHAAAVPVLSLQLQLREWRHHRLANQRCTPVDDVVALNLLFPLIDAGHPGPQRTLPWPEARAKLQSWLPPLST
jgi:hypothetical protein